MGEIEKATSWYLLLLCVTAFLNQAKAPMMCTLTEFGIVSFSPSLDTVCKCLGIKCNT